MSSQPIFRSPIRFANIARRPGAAARTRRHVVAPTATVYLPGIKRLGSGLMMLSRRDLLGASAVLLSGTAVTLRAAAAKEAAHGSGPLVLCWNENPYGPSPAARAAVSQSIAEACRYPSDEEMAALVAAIAAREGIAA